MRRHPFWIVCFQCHWLVHPHLIWYPGQKNLFKQRGHICKCFLLLYRVNRPPSTSFFVVTPMKSKHMYKNKKNGFYFYFSVWKSYCNLKPIIKYWAFVFISSLLCWAIFFKTNVSVDMMVMVQGSKSIPASICGWIIWMSLGGIRIYKILKIFKLCCPSVIKK